MMGRGLNFALLLIIAPSLACAWDESSGAGTSTGGGATTETATTGEPVTTSGEPSGTSGEPTGTSSATGSSSSTGELEVIDCPKTIYGDHVDYDDDGILDLFLDEQEEVALMTGCTHVYSSLIIRKEVSDLSALASLRHIEGTLYIRGDGAKHDSVASIAGLEGLRTVGGLDFEWVQIESLEPLSGLTEIPGDVKIAEFINLTSLEGLHNIEEIGGSIWIDKGKHLQDLNGLRGLKRVGRDVMLRELGVVDLHGLEGLTEVGAPGGEESRVMLTYLGDLVSLDALAIAWHDAHAVSINSTGITDLHGFAGVPELRRLELYNSYALADLAGLESLEVVRDGLVLDDNDELVDIGALAKLREVGGLTLAGSRVADLSLPGLETIGDVRIGRNYELTSLSALAGFASLGSLVLEFNPLLAGLPELTQLAKVEGDLEIRANDALTTLADLAAVTEVGGRLVVVVNPELLESEAEAWGALIVVGEDRKIAGNKGDLDPPADPCPWEGDLECDDTWNGIGICAGGSDWWDCATD